MTDSDLRELDGWIAEKLFNGERVAICLADDHATDDNSWCYTCNCLVSDTEEVARRYSSDPSAFTLVKREIERRGGSWNCRFDKAVKQHGDWPYWFTIWMPDLDQSVSTWGETEELAGCLAVKAAVEGSNAKSN